jgi:dienelactone hydrolase
MGGGYALDLALPDPTLAADVINYGHLATDPNGLNQINAPILGIFGGQDGGITPDDVKKFEQALKQEGKSVEVHVYPDAGHAFQNPNNKDGYRAETLPMLGSALSGFWKALGRSNVACAHRSVRSRSHCKPISRCVCN